jgi:hypothetical protein
VPQGAEAEVKESGIQLQSGGPQLPSQFKTLSSSTESDSGSGIQFLC